MTVWPGLDRMHDEPPLLGSQLGTVCCVAGGDSDVAGAERAGKPPHTPSVNGGQKISGNNTGSEGGSSPGAAPACLPPLHPWVERFGRADCQEGGGVSPTAAMPFTPFTKQTRCQCPSTAPKSAQPIGFTCRSGRSASSGNRQGRALRLSRMQSISQ